ncbi:hypothetical protein B4135_3461 [Caldibacillus debilis]|uniref:Uncharacterized protein n=1 Tax=Caldibacillus debilis TaxID=301148 RepID=A0A150LE93_9BACI|nr:hypothetical protein B4135_3461 [Caldibacillus debilis]
MGTVGGFVPRMAHGLSCGFSAGRFSEKDEKKPSRQAGTAGEEVKTRVRIRYISRFYRPFHWADRLPWAEVFRPFHRGVHPKGSFIARPMGGPVHPRPSFIVRSVRRVPLSRAEIYRPFHLA